MKRFETPKHWLCKIMAGSLCFLAALAFASSRSLVVVPLSHVVPDQVLPAVKTVLPDGATVTSYNNQLILNVTPDEKATVEELLQQIDIAAAQLRISVRTPRSRTRVGQGVAFSGTFADGRIQIGDNKKPGKVVIRSDSALTSRNGQQSVRATEGMPAYIAVGSTIPVTTYRINSFGNREAVTAYKAADQGFYVTARVTGDQVILDIRQTDDSREENSTIIKTRHLSTQISGELGQWITISGTGSSTQSHNKGLVIRSSDSGSDTGTVELLVERL